MMGTALGHRRRRVALFICVSLVAALRCADAQDSYAVTPLTFTPAALNSSGVVVGQNAQSHACIFSNGQTTDLGTLGGSSSAATAVNSAGQIAGYSLTSGDSATHAFLYSNGQMIDLGVLPGGSASYATGINDSGVVAGYSNTTPSGATYPNPDHAFTYSGGHMTDLGNISASSQFVNFSHANAINQQGWVTGWSNTDSGNAHAFLYNGGHMADLGTLAAPYNYASYGNGIDSAGDIVGFSEDENFVRHAFLYAQGIITDLGVPSGYTQSSATGINDSGQVIGVVSGGSSDPSRYCFIYSTSTGFTNIRSLISDSNVTISDAKAINNNGQIIATGNDFGPDGGDVVGFLLTPNGIASSPTPSPIPSPTPTPQVRFVGQVSFSINPANKTTVVTAAKIQNTRSAATAPLRLALWAFPQGFTGSQLGYQLATYQLPPLAGGAEYDNVDSGPVALTAPPSGYWHIALFLEELTNNSSSNQGYSYWDYVDFATVYIQGNAAPAPTPAQLANISTRGVIQSGDSVMIGGFIVTGNDEKKVIVRGIGPSLPIAGALADPILELHGPAGTIATNDNWQDTQASDITATGIAPTNNFEPALIANLAGGNTGYTAVLAGKGGASGIGLIEVYDLSMSQISTLANISTRGFVDTGDNVMIGGFITTPANGISKILVRGIGPSLAAQGVNGALPDPMLELHDANGGTVAANDDWKETQQVEIEATGIPPGNDSESALVQTLWAGNFTAILRGKNDSTGVGLVEIYKLP